MAFSDIPRVVLGIGGVLLIALVWMDALTTTLTLQGSGPITRVISRIGDWAARQLYRSRRGAPLRMHLGTAVVSLKAIVWMALMWVGWWLVFSVDAQAVIDGTQKTPADALTRFYFAGMSLSTLGTGDYVANAPFLRVVMTVAAASGFVFITLFVSYFTSVTNAVVTRRKAALQIATLGSSGPDMLRRGWDGEGFGPFVGRATALAAPLMEIEQLQEAYPIVRLFISEQRSAELSVQLSTLADALFLLCHGVDARLRPPAYDVEALVTSVSRQLRAFQETRFPFPRSSQAPDRAPLREAGVPLTKEEDYTSAWERHAQADLDEAARPSSSTGRPAAQGD